MAGTCADVQVFSCVVVQMYRCADVKYTGFNEVVKSAEVLLSAQWDPTTLVQCWAVRSSKQHTVTMGLSSQVPIWINIPLHNCKGVYVSCSSNRLQAFPCYEVVVLHSTTFYAVQGLPIIQTQTFEVTYHPLPHGCSAQALVWLQGLAVGG